MSSKIIREKNKNANKCNLREVGCDFTALWQNCQLDKFLNCIKSQSCSTPLGFSAPTKMPKFVPRQRKHKNKLKETNPIPQQDTNVAELAPVSKLEKEEKRRKYREELLAQQPRISGKKQKRLDKYIVRSILSMCVSHFLRH